MHKSEDERFMKLAIRHAQHAYREKEVPVGAVIVDDQGEVIAASRNRVEATHDATAHAEVDCMRKAALFKQNWRLLDCTLYTTLEPCPTCLSAAQSFRIKRLVYAAKDLRLGACGSHINLADAIHPYHQVEIEGGVLEEEASILLRRFFQSVREGKYKYGSYDLGRGDMMLPR
ncbi:nucleoside deaminase [archaeon]|nr:MAG: nucleoside deaminase [archaeon]